MNMQFSPPVAQGATHDETPLPIMRLAPQDDPSLYRPDRDLMEAVRVALILGQPLLLTGEPGTGKTHLAAYLAWALQTPDSPLFQPDAPSTHHLPLIFETKSTSTSRDLFYSYDMVSRFHAAQTGEGSQKSVDYLNYNAFGVAVLHSMEPGDVEPHVPGHFRHLGRQRFVVLIDEIDKAPRDFPNDILNEIEGMYFRVPELNNRSFTSDRRYRPVVVMTSNSERNLPDAFLRRCIYYHIPFPDRERLMEIVRVRVPGAGNAITPESPAKTSRFVSDAVNLFTMFRTPSAALAKKPATAELIGWLKACLARRPDLEAAGTDPRNREIIRSSLFALIKTQEDRKTAARLFEEWAAGKSFQYIAER